MNTITLPQPLAALVMLGVKTLDPRPYGTLHRGPLAIHSANRPVTSGSFAWDAAMRGDVRKHLQAAGWTDPEHLPAGVVMGEVQLVDVLTPGEAYTRGLLTPWELSLGSYYERGEDGALVLSAGRGRSVWCFKDPVLYPPVGYSATAPARGHMWIWTRPNYPPPLGGA